MSEKRFIGRELKKNPTGIKILRTETSPTNEDQFVHDELQEIIKQEHDLSDQESSNSMDINEQTELDFEKPLLSHALNSLNNHQEIEVTIQTLETFRDDIGKFSMLPPFWLYMEVPNGLEFMRLDPATMLIKNHLRLNEELSVTVIFPNKDELLLDVKINSYSNTYDYLNSVENWPQCCGTQFEDEKYSDKCKGVVVGEDTYKRNQKYQRCKYCKILRSRLQNCKSTSTTVTKQIAPNTAEPCKDLEIMNTLKTAHSLKEDGDPEIKIEQEADMQEDYADEHLIEFDNDDDDFTSQIKYEMIEEPFRLADESETRKSSRLQNKAQNVEHLTEAITTDKSLDENNLKVKESKPKKVSKPKQETEKAVEAKKVKLSTKKAKEKKDDTKLLCGLCENSYEDRSSLHDHLEKHKRGSQCSLCEDIHRDWTCLISHRVRHVPEPQMRCHICWKSVKRDYYLEYHYKTKHWDQEFTELACKICKYKTQSPNKMHRHVSYNHSGKQYRCDICQKVFSDKAAVKSHIVRSHAEKKKRFKCDVCDYSCTMSSNLTAHKLWRHATEKYFCKMCTRIFGDRSKLESHSCTTKQVLCPVCGKQVTARMKRHMASHSSDRPHACPQCPATYKSRAALQIHLNVHAGTRTEQCDFCPRRFYSKCVLIKHRRVHTGEKPFVCVVCEKGFTSNHNLKVHMKVHGESLVVKRNPENKDNKSSIKHE